MSKYTHESLTNNGMTELESQNFLQEKVNTALEEGRKVTRVRRDGLVREIYVS